MSATITFNEQGIDNVVIQKLEIFMSNPVFDISLSTSKEIVGNSHLVPLKHQLVNKMRSNKTSPASYLK